ncbi:DMT family transporter [Halobellus sp. Atlit-38R]|uniref:DMT family transporter n=1 Tax=Halobellus sp. Atlit-38R TaxID=2282131 RepID=UPI000EF20A84|nr:DMT family transporter [Halobellus sp. Atlit-38R]
MTSVTGVVALSVISGVLWGIGPIFSKLGMERGGQPRRATLIVLLVGATVFWALSLARGTVHSLVTQLPIQTISIFAISGVIGTSMAWLLWFRGIKWVGASVSNVLFYTQPLFAALLAALTLGENLTPTTITGVVLIVSGVGLLSLSGSTNLQSRASTALLFPLAAAVFAAVSNVLNRFGFQTSAATPLEAATINLTSALPLVVGHTLMFHTDAITTPSPSDMYFVGSGLANAAAVFTMFTALSNGPVVIVAPLVSTSPLFTTALAYVVLTDVENVTSRTIVSALLTVLGAAITAF